MNSVIKRYLTKHLESGLTRELMKINKNKVEIRHKQKRPQH